MKLFNAVLVFALMFGLNQITAKSISNSERDDHRQEGNDINGDLHQPFNEDESSQPTSQPANQPTEYGETLREITNDPAIPMLFTMGFFTLMSMLSKVSCVPSG